MGHKQPQRDVGEPLMLTYKEAMAKINVSDYVFYQLLREGTLHSLDVGPQTKRIATAECQAYVDELLAAATGTQGEKAS